MEWVIFCGCVEEGRDDLGGVLIFVRTKNSVFGTFLTIFGHFVAKSPLYIGFSLYI
jgi:hypothetical protein